MNSNTQFTSRSSHKRPHPDVSSSSRNLVSHPSHAKRLSEWQQASAAWKISYDQKVAHCISFNQPPIGPIELYSELITSNCLSNENNEDDQSMSRSTAGLISLLNSTRSPQSQIKSNHTAASLDCSLTPLRTYPSNKPSSILLAPETPATSQFFPPHLIKTFNHGARSTSPFGSSVPVASQADYPSNPRTNKPASILLAPETPETATGFVPPLPEPSLVSPLSLIDKKNVFAPKAKQPISLIKGRLNSSPPTREIQNSSGQLVMDPVASDSHDLPPTSNSTFTLGNTKVEQSKSRRRPLKSKQIESLSDYDRLSSKERSVRFPTVKIWAEFLSQAVKISSNPKVKDFMKRCRVYYLINPNLQTKLDEADRIRMRRLAQVGAQIQPELKTNHVTHLIVRDHTSWNSCLQAIKSVVNDPVERQKIKEMCLSSSDKIPGEELIWVLDFKWLETCLTHQAIPAEKYMRILPRAFQNLMPQKPHSSEVRNTGQSILTDNYDQSYSSCDEIETSISLNSGKYRMVRHCKENEIVIPGLERQIQLARLGEGAETDGSRDEEIDEVTLSRSSPDVDHPGLATTAPKYKNTNRHASDRPGSGTVKRNGPNEDICQKLEKIIELYASNPNDQFRILAIRRAVNILRIQSKRVDDFDTLSKLKDIGPKTAQQIIEIANTSTHRRLQLVTEQDACRQLFKGIYGVNETLALKWYQKGLRNLDDVHHRKGDISLSTSQELGLRFYDDLQERIPREEVKLIFDQITQAALEVDSRLKLFPMGSYRRGQESCEDIQVILTRDESDGISYHDSMRRLYNLLKRKGLITYELSSTEKVDKNNLMLMCLCAFNRPGFGKQRRIDLLGVPHDQLGAALIYFTGNEIFNRAMRLKARHLGYTLNRNGLFKSFSSNFHSQFDHLIHRSTSKDAQKNHHSLVASRTEEEIFKILEVQFLKPEERNM